ncbi:PREDICTED: uncharacterized protein LOC109481707 [Branchiostoma belcheri]|uniref:Uncharacterized protein LOC109481707 n=1 Tax=Branchiostoma belcheri TaxID=7741 RepID=A0A6P4ZF53_BRABE|nr:PREDICTED: uncharacterized protein LOC109481707 [Branchiostoma belcheri]XP_019639858.1 PREDICTED: uncharacterized protein LOC109481707 [Branchiostoma belcheri]XP_019639860.1 PREDICTED: uncharacterized protein LOC109481707 [Branchiostoma belcheri]
MHKTPLLFIMVTALLVVQEAQSVALGKGPLRSRRQTEVSVTQEKSRGRVEQARLVWLHSLLDALATAEDDPLVELLFPDEELESPSSTDSGSDDVDRRRRKKDASRHFRLGGYLGYRPAAQAQSKRNLSEYLVKSDEQRLKRQALLAALLGLVDEALFHPEAAGNAGSDGVVGPNAYEKFIAQNQAEQ